MFALVLAAVLALPQPLSPATPVSTAVPNTMQFAPSVAATANSFAVAWLEYGPDEFVHTFISRFSQPTGTPLDVQPLEVDSAPRLNLPPGYVAPPVLTAMRDVYVVNGRRLDAVTGMWIDNKASIVNAGASNGSDALLAILGGMLQRVPADGPAADPVPLPSNARYPAVASNGVDYLVAWNRSADYCIFGCHPITDALSALRVHADGTWIDAAPIQFASFGQDPSIASARGMYVVAWTRVNGGVYATRVTFDGVVRDSEVIVAWAGQQERVKPLLVRFGDGVLLFVHRIPGNTASKWTMTWLNLDNLVATGATDGDVVPAADGLLSATTVDGRLVVAFENGSVPRVYVQQFALPRRRTIAH